MPLNTRRPEKYPFILIIRTRLSLKIQVSASSRKIFPAFLKKGLPAITDAPIKKLPALAFGCAAGLQTCSLILYASNQNRIGEQEFISVFLQNVSVWISPLHQCDMPPFNFVRSNPGNVSQNYGSPFPVFIY